ncbi:hypothetical protein H2200_005488 [Cladophialophora chaetospira]|uniref:Uncharacterized protein n=1 Tax=Cladophialophora chaetospira TaxID=386627 RepID=A0AA39CJW4_9EURO|nr:hypothetical protein H2200_005488 [Cladophialophora chaetospira]
MKFNLASLCIALLGLGLGNVSANPVIDLTDQHVTHNATNELAARGVATGVYDINPRPFGSPCGQTWTVTMTVDNAGDQAHASPLCKYLHAEFNQPTGDGFMPKKYNLIYLCPDPQWAQPLNGYGTEDTKLIVNGPMMFPGTLRSFGANLNIKKAYTSPPTDINIPISVNYFFDDKNPAKLGFKFLTFTSIQCASVA